MSFSWSLTRAHMRTVTTHTCCRKYTKKAGGGLEKKKQWMFVLLSNLICNVCMVDSQRSVCIHCASFLSLPSLLIDFSLSLWCKTSPSLSLSMLSYGLHVFSVSLGHCSACLPQSIVHGWLANHSYTILKRQSVLVTWDMFTGCHIVYVCCMLHSLTLRTIYSCAG